MGTTQSKYDDIDKFEKALDFFCGSCNCSTEMDVEDIMLRQQQRQQDRNPHLTSYKGDGMTSEVQKHLDIVHQSSEPYLGISVWEPVNDAFDNNFLDISTHASEDEFQPRADPSDEEKRLTPPRCIELNTSNEHVSSPSFLIQKKSSFSSPSFRTSRTDGSSVSESSVRTGTTASTEINAVEATYSSTHIQTPNGLFKEDHVRVFEPRKLFDTYEESEHNYNSSGLLLDHNDFNIKPPPKTNRTVTSYSIDTPSKSTSADQSIMIRNGILVKEMQAPSPQSTSKSVSSPNSTLYIPDGVEKNHMRHINTLPSFKRKHPIRLRIVESYAGYETRNVGDENEVNESNTSLLSDAEQEHFFSYDPYFSLGQYIISTLNGDQYGNGLSVKMGERYMTLQDKNERVWGVMRSRHTWIPSAIIYSPTARYPTQTPSSHRPCGDDVVCDADSVELFPWALVKKHGRRMDHHVSIHIVSESRTNNELVGGLFEKVPSFTSRHGFDAMDNHQHTIVYKMNGEDEVPCCMMERDPIQRDLFNVTIAPGIDPLMIICYMAVHSKMDVEPKLSDR